MRNRCAVLLVLGLTPSTLGIAAAAGPRGALLVDGFESLDGWSARPSDGVELAIHPDSGLVGRAMRLDVRFVKGGGYAVVHKDLALDLPDHYRFRFRIRGNCPPNNLEFKLIDSTGANVWWSNRRNVRFSASWDSVTLRQRHISFAWGPAGGGEIRHVAAIEFAVTAGGGGAGSVWLDQLELESLPPPDSVARAPLARASSSRSGHAPGGAVDGNAATDWVAAPGDRAPWLALDLGGEREFGGLVVDWGPGRAATDYDVEFSSDGARWRTVREARGGNGGRDPLFLPESETRHVRLRVLKAAGPGGVAVREVIVEPLAWSASLETFYRSIAGDAPRGSYPRAILGEQSYWTIVGVDGDERESLVNEDGMIESGQGGFSVEPFLFTGGRLVTWANAEIAQSLDGGGRPIPTVRWRAGAMELSVTSIATGAPGASSVFARYRVANRGDRATRATLFLALRPFQVNPPAQFLGSPGGTAPIRELEQAGRVVRVNGDRGVASLTAPSGFGAATFDQGDVVESLRAGRLPPGRRVRDPFEHASGALAYRLELAPGEEREVDLQVPLYGVPGPPRPAAEADVRREVAERLAVCRRGWRERLGRVTIMLPDSAADVVRTLEAQLAYILINRDGAAIQPGSRAYDRSWIRDGALTSSALLRLGHPETVREYIEWFAPYQYADGKVPCCVDERGSDPVPEHDSSGEFIYLVAEYYRYTGDRALVERMWPHVARAAAYLDSLRRLRRTAEYRAPGRAVFFGLLPPSISHEGYSAKPMHSYWDDFFALRGFKDAAYLAGVLGQGRERARLAAIRDQFQGELVASIRAAMRVHGIDYIPGAADLGDFDATSTTIAITPVEADRALPRAALVRTFEKYWEFFRARRDGEAGWEALTPYELRNLGAFVHLGWRDRAQELLRFFMACRRPAGWAEWAEVVWRDARAAKFIGDMPHTWVGSDFVRAVLDMLAYAREDEQTLVLGAGVPLAWVSRAPGVVVRDLPTPYGLLSYTMRLHGAALEVSLAGGLRVPRGGIVLRPPPAGFRRATIDGTAVPLMAAGEVVVRRVPATVVLSR